MQNARLYLAPAAAGKTAYALARAREAARGLDVTPRVVVPTHLQARAWRRRLAQSGGALGVRLFTFDELYAECLNAADEAYTLLSEPVQYRLIRAVVDDLYLDHYAPLASKPGFIRILQRLIGELKAARVHPDTFSQAAGDESRLSELAQVYAAYQARLQRQRWADRAGMAWLTLETLEQGAPSVASDWSLLIVDGFDSFTTVQLDMLRVLAGRIGQLLITLTGNSGGEPRLFVHKRFNRTCAQLESLLDIKANPLPNNQSDPLAESVQDLALAHLEAHLFRSEMAQFGMPAGQGLQGEAAPGIQDLPGDSDRAAQGFVRASEPGSVGLIEAPDRGAEVRAALRWLKARVVEEGMEPGELALLARDIGPYRRFVLQTAAEFGMPIRLLGGMPLSRNPAIAALLDLLRLMLPRSAADPAPALPRRPVVEAWRSPYFDWSALPCEDAPEPIAIGPGDADTLDAVARHGSVIGGMRQWTGILDSLAAYAAPGTRGSELDGLGEDEESGLPPGIPIGPGAQELRAKFHRFVQRLTPPTGEHTYRGYVRWLETLIGPDPDARSSRYPSPSEPTALRVVERVRDAIDEIRERDLAALQALKDVLRGLVWAEEALASETGMAPGPAIDFHRFFGELAGAVESASYQLPTYPDHSGIVVAGAMKARGVPFRAVAVLGLAEGEFPATLGEDPFLRDADRQRLREEFGLPLDASTESAEIEFFYETITRASERLLLTRPRLAENGALWQASPFWEEVRTLLPVDPLVLTSESLPEPERAASWPELMDSLAAQPALDDVRAWVGRVEPERQAAIDAAVALLHLRRRRAPGSPYDGDLGGLAGEMARRFGPHRAWSASRLETYRSCPFFFFVGQVLKLEPRPEPAEGLDARQLGNLYHRIFERIYQDPRVSDPSDLEQVLAVIPEVAGAILDAAPEREGFRKTAWWAQTRDEILANVRDSLEALAKLPGGYVPALHEAVFGLDGRPPLVVRQGEDSFLLRGVIDRVDRAPDGRVRVVDYKTAGPWTFSKKAVTEGKKLQLPLYALAARDALGLGEPAEGFYWHVRQAEPSGFQMSRFDGGPQAAMDIAVENAWQAVRSARDGYFVPYPPSDGCPSYCPAGAFCWHYRPVWGG